MSTSVSSHDDKDVDDKNKQLLGFDSLFKEVAKAVIEYTGLVALLFVQLPLVFLVALWPPLDHLLKRSSRFYLLGSPLVKFSIAFISDVAFAWVVTFSDRATFAQMLLYEEVPGAPSWLVRQQQLARNPRPSCAAR